MKMPMRLLGTLLLTAAMLSCGGDADTVETSCNGGDKNGNSLDGSFCEDVPMLFTEVRIRLLVSNGALWVEYRRPLSESYETTLQFIILGSQVPITPNAEINMQTAMMQIRRLLTEGVLTLTQEVDDGSWIKFTKYTGEIDSDAEGEFHILFKNGRTLNGKFGGKILDAEKIAREEG